MDKNQLLGRCLWVRLLLNQYRMEKVPIEPHCRWGKVGEFKTGTWFWILKLSQKGVSSPSKQSVVCVCDTSSCFSPCLMLGFVKQCVCSTGVLILWFLCSFSQKQVYQELPDSERLHMTLLCTSWEKIISSSLYLEQNTSMLESAELKRCSLYIHIPLFFPSCQMPQKYNLKVIGILWDSKHLF